MSSVAVKVLFSFVSFVLILSISKHSEVLLATKPIGRERRHGRKESKSRKDILKPITDLTVLNWQTNSESSFRRGKQF